MSTTQATTTTTDANTRRRLGTAVTSLVLGTLAFASLLFWYPSVALLIAILGLMFGGLAVYRSREAKGLWVTALTLNAVTLALFAFVYL